ncbi:hypothetical protein M5K25_011886 [Dendrobium thyrsiflorum]|uniref:Uncharacterized protein n=1 Tax=Dendrobium thyrsiflorum TaxID=117978 RepID=A0ABD0VBG7_DENTH
MSTFLQSIDYKMWMLVKDGYIAPFQMINGIKSEVHFSEWSHDERDLAQLNAKCLNCFFCALKSEDYMRVSTCTTEKEIWDKLSITYEGVDLDFSPSSRELSASPSFVKPRSQDTRSLPPPLGLSLELQAARSRSLLSFSVRRSPRLPVSSSHSKESRRKIELKPFHSLDLFRESKRKAVSPLEPKPFVSWTYPEEPEGQMIQRSKSVKAYDHFVLRDSAVVPFIF